MEKTTLPLTVTLILGTLSFADKVHGQVFIQDLGTINAGDTIRATVNFATGNEIYVGFINLAVDCTIGSGNIMVYRTMGSIADTEIAIYGPNGLTLIAANDDGESGSWGDPGFGSLLYFGIPPVGNGDEYNGYTNQSFNEWVNPTGLSAGDYVLILSTYSTVWDELDVRDTTFGSRDTGTAEVTIMVF